MDLTTKKNRMENKVSKLKEVDRRALDFIDILIDTGKINFKKEFCDEVGLLKQNLYNIEQGNSSFRVTHIMRMIKIYNVSVEWLFRGVGAPFFTPEQYK